MCLFFCDIFTHRFKRERERKGWGKTVDRADCFLGCTLNEVPEDQNEILSQPQPHHAVNDQNNSDTSVNSGNAHTSEKTAKAKSKTSITITTTPKRPTTSKTNTGKEDGELSDETGAKVLAEKVSQDRSENDTTEQTEPLEG